MKTSFAFALGCCALVASASAQTQKGVKPPPSSIPQRATPTLTTSSLLPPLPDECASAMAISGTGAFPVDTTGLTTSVQQSGTCPTSNNDGWMAWTASASCATFSLCGSTTTDTVMAVYNGCGGTLLACNDDTCGLVSEVSVNGMTVGNVYYIQIGAYTAGNAVVGSLTITVPAAGVGDDNCATPTALSGPGTYPYDNTTATTGCEGQSEAACLSFGTTRLVADRWYTYTAGVNGTATVSTCGLLTSTASKDTRIAVYAGAGCPSAAAIGCNDDIGSACTQSTLESAVTWNVTCGTTYTIQIGQYLTGAGVIVGQFNLSESGSTCAPPPVAYCFGDGSGGACPCGNTGASGNGCANSVNAAGANLAATGTASIASDTLVLNGTGMPNSSCLYFQGDVQINSGNGVAFGDGLRCAGTGVRRIGTKINAAGASSYPVGADAPVSVRGGVVAPGTKNYQAWYRNADPTFCTPSTFNLSNGLAVTWF